MDNLSPHSLEIEQAVLGGLMAGRDAWVSIAGVLQPEHFHEPLHGRIYAALIKMASEGCEPSLLLLKPRMEGDPALREIGGGEYLVGLYTPPPLVLESHAKLMRELAERRMAIASCTEAIESFRDTASADFRSSVSRHLGCITGVFDGARERQTCFTIADSTSNAVERLNRLRAGEPNPNAISTRIPALDGVTGGLRRGEYIVIGARPSMGKTALAVQLAMNIAEASGGVAYFSLEMPEALLAPRFLSSKLWHPNRNGPTYQALLKGYVSDLEVGYAADAVEEMKNWPLYIEDEPGLTAASASGFSKQLVMRPEKNCSESSKRRGAPEPMTPSPTLPRLSTKSAPPAPGPEDFDMAKWTAVVTIATKAGIWDRAWGQPPGKKGCRMPAAMITPDLVNALEQGASRR
jgi:replicative DNA helicase